MSGTEKQSGKPGLRPWVRPAIKETGNVADVLQGGSNKLSLVSQDPGDTRKPSGQG